MAIVGAVGFGQHESERIPPSESLSIGIKKLEEIGFLKNVKSMRITATENEGNWTLRVQELPLIYDAEMTVRIRKDGSIGVSR